MINQLTVKISGIKGIRNGHITLPLDNNLYAIVGTNGSGKSTIMLALSQLISRFSINILREEDYSLDSFIEFQYGDRVTKWHRHNGYWISSHNTRERIQFNGTYEGSLFYGNRFQDSTIVDDLLKSKKLKETDIVDADDYVQRELGRILHGKIDFYNGLKRVKNRDICKELDLKNVPYFKEVNGKLISQYRMSSGECLLISLLHFIYNSLIRRSLDKHQPILMLIDEIELALHPSAVDRLMKYLKFLLGEYKNLTIIVTSHAPEVIRSILPRNMYKIDRVRNNSENEFNITNPCYPSYAIRDIYGNHNGYDLVILVEDNLAALLLETSIKNLELRNSKLIHITPVGGYSNVLELHHNLLVNNVLGVNTNLISILDGDIKTQRLGDKYKDLKKVFLPIESIEKFLLKYLIKNKDESSSLKITQYLSDNLFRLKSLKNIVDEFYTNEFEKVQKYSDNERKKNPNIKFHRDIHECVLENNKNGKNLFYHLLKELNSINLSEKDLVEKVFDLILNLDIFQQELIKFNTQLKEMIDALLNNKK